MPKIFDAEDVAKVEGYRDATDRIRLYPHRHNATNMPIWNGGLCASPPVTARVNAGRWIADCECGGAEYVAPSAPFFCFSCGNVLSQGKARPVTFPSNKVAIEEALLEREFLPSPSKNPVTAMENSVKLHGIGHDWTPGESIKTLRDQHRIAKSLKEGKVK